MKILNCAQIQNRDDLFRLLHDVLPGEYGNNLDALHDYLTSLSAPTELTLQNWPAAEEVLGRYANALKRMLTDAEAENPLLTIHYI